VDHSPLTGCLRVSTVKRAIATGDQIRALEVEMIAPTDRLVIERRTGRRLDVDLIAVGDRPDACGSKLIGPGDRGIVAARACDVA
jgi:hypothetical protein